jgi:hypothetical protein
MNTHSRFAAYITLAAGLAVMGGCEQDTALKTCYKRSDCFDSHRPAKRSKGGLEFKCENPPACDIQTFKGKMFKVKEVHGTPVFTHYKKKPAEKNYSQDDDIVTPILIKSLTNDEDDNSLGQSF